MAETEGIPAMSNCIARVQRNRIFEFRFGFLPLPLILLFDGGEGDVWFRQTRIQRDGFLGILYGFWVSKLWRNVAVSPQKQVCVRKSRVSRPKAGIFRNGTLELFEGSIKSIKFSLIPEIPSFEVVSISFCALC